MSVSPITIITQYEVVMVVDLIVLILKREMNFKKMSEMIG
jgi:hypothetical protein